MGGNQGQDTALEGEVRERRERVRMSMTALEAAIASPEGDDPAAWVKRIAGELATLRDVWTHHVEATEKPDGLLDRVVHEVPRLAHEHDLLLREHRDIAAAIDGLESTSDVDGVREGTIALLGMLVRHRHRGANFVYEAYSLDVGTGE